MSRQGSPHPCGRGNYRGEARQPRKFYVYICPRGRKLECDVEPALLDWRKFVALFRGQADIFCGLPKQANARPVLTRCFFPSQKWRSSVAKKAKTAGMCRWRLKGCLEPYVIRSAFRAQRSCVDDCRIVFRGKLVVTAAQNFHGRAVGKLVFAMSSKAPFFSAIWADWEMLWKCSTPSHSLESKHEFLRGNAGFIFSLRPPQASMWSSWDRFRFRWDGHVSFFALFFCFLLWDVIYTCVHEELIWFVGKLPSACLAPILLYGAVPASPCRPGRHEVFFDEVEDFKCPECDAPRSAFYDANDKDDPHNIKVRCTIVVRVSLVQPLAPQTQLLVLLLVAVVVVVVRSCRWLTFCFVPLLGCLSCSCMLPAQRRARSKSRSKSSGRQRGRRRRRWRGERRSVCCCGGDVKCGRIKGVRTDRKTCLSSFF